MKNENLVQPPPFTWQSTTNRVERAPSFLPLEPTASVLGVPRAWLKREADAGRIPLLSVGRRRLFNPSAVAQALLGRAEQRETGRKP